MTRRRGLHRVLATLQQAVDLGYDPVKVIYSPYVRHAEQMLRCSPGKRLMITPS
jgi:hypothetical protein